MGVECWVNGCWNFEVEGCLWQAIEESPLLPAIDTLQPQIPTPICPALNTHLTELEIKLHFCHMMHLQNLFDSHGLLHANGYSAYIHEASSHVLGFRVQGLGLMFNLILHEYGLDILSHPSSLNPKP